MPTGNVKAYWQGTKILDSVSFTSIAHDDTDNNFYHYYNGIAWVWTTTVWDFSYIQGCFVNGMLGTANRFGVRESHGFIPWMTHKDNHFGTGTLRLSGGIPSSYVLASPTLANRRPSITACTMLDEDLETTNATLADNGPYQQLYYSGTSMVTAIGSDIVPISTNAGRYNLITTAAGVITSSTLATIPNSSYGAVWLVSIPVTADPQSQDFRYVWILGQATGNLTTVQALTFAGLVGYSAISTEYVVSAKIIIRNVADAMQLTSVEILTTSKVSSVSVSGMTSVTTDETLIGGGTIASPLGINPAILYQNYPLALNTSWTIDHTMLHPIPEVTVVDSSGQDIELEVVYDPVVTNRIHLYAGYPLSGTVYLS
jgi:hypothetical protein